MEKIILDCDTGSDDAIAITAALLSKDIDIIGICTVGGNVEVKNTTDNTLRVVECCDMQNKVKVYRGAALPIASTLEPWGLQAQELPRMEGKTDQEFAVHTDHLPLPKPTIHEEEERAVPWLINTLMHSKDREITIVPVGPITNLALALRSDERIAGKIKRIVMMGGAHNAYPLTQAAEFNVWCDPEALEIVLQSGIPLTMVSLDATSHACVSMEQVMEIESIGTKPAKLCAKLITQRNIASKHEGDKKDAPVGMALHDVLAVCAVVHPEVLITKDVSCHVDIGRGYAYGETILDRNYKFEQIPINCTYAYNADSELFFKWLYNTLKNV